MKSVFLCVLFLGLAATSLPAAAPRDYQHAPGQSADTARQVWKDATKGVNLALGKKVIFSQKPDYRLTAGPGDATDLTDGKLSQRRDDRIWFDRDAVGWTQADRGVNLLIDLGSKQPVGTVVARFLGGAEQPSLLFPAEIIVVGSDDGKTFYPLTSLVKVTAGESELSEQNPDRYFHIPETGRAATHTFVLNVHRIVRYIGLHLKGARAFVFTDQIAVMKDQKPAGALSLVGLKPMQFIIHGVALRPRQKNLVITTNIATPNYFIVTDARAESDRKTPLRFQIDLPEGVTITKATHGAEARRDDSARQKNRWILTNFYDARHNKVAALYFALDEKGALSKNAVATFTNDDPDSAQNIVTVPVKTIEIPDVGNDAALDVSLAWMRVGDQRRFPEFFHAFRRMGFNMIGVFPRYARTDAERKELAEYVEQARQNGFRIVYNESAFHVMAGRHKTAPEIYNQINGKRGKRVCPTYTGN